MISDSHCHLDLFEQPLKTIELSQKQGVDSFFSCATDKASMEQHLSIFSGMKNVKIGFGLHPSDLLRIEKEEAEKALDFLEKNISSAHAVGEVGLDFKHATKDWQKAMQKEFFSRQIDTALENSLSLAVHSRFAEKECLELLEKKGTQKVLLHWFTYSAKFMQKASDMGFFMSCGPIIFSSKESLEAALQIPPENLLIETDCPVAFLGKQSDPSWAIRVAEFIAEKKKIPKKKLFLQCQKNYFRLFDTKS